jgi:ATP-binding cassette subfamily B protein
MSAKHSTRTKSVLHELRRLVKQWVQVWGMVPRHSKAAFVGASCIMAATAACSTAIPLLLGNLVDGVKVGIGQSSPPEALYSLAARYLEFIAVAYLVREVLQVLRRYLVENSCTRLEKIMTIKLVSHLMKVDLSSLTREKVGALQGRISRCVVSFVRFLRLALLDFLPPLAAGLFALIAALTKQPWLALAMAGVIPVSLLLTSWQINSQKGIRLKLITGREAMDGTVVELLGGMDYIRAAHTHEHEVHRLAKVAEKRRAREVRHHFQMSLFGCAKALNEGFFHVVVLALAIFLAVRGAITFGDILTFSMLFLNVMAPLNEVHRGLDEGHECSLQVADLRAMLAEPIDHSFSPSTAQEPNLKNGSALVDVEDLAVQYSTADGQLKSALRAVSVTIRHGETVGIVGRSGCGKTTLLRVLMRLTHPSHGQVLVGGVPLEHVSRQAIGKLIGYVGQFPFVFSGTIRDNIAYGMAGAADDDIRRAAEAAFIHDEIMTMPGGYEALVCERGQNLSGGQRQRLALARIFLKNPPILILDEGTSALDTISERNVQRAIHAARADRTVLLVAHRLSTLLDVDTIFVFEGGSIVERGTYGELLGYGGIFTEMARCAEHGPGVKTAQ